MNKKVIIFWIIVAAVLIGLTYAVRGILLPFILAFVLAYILNPLVVRWQKKGASRTKASLGVLVGLIVAILSVFLILIPILQAQIIGFVQKVPAYANALWIKLQPLFDWFGSYISHEQISLFKQSLSSQSLGFFNKIGLALLDTVSGGLILFNIITFILITPVITFYLLNDWETIVTKIKGLVPEKKKDFIQGQMAQIDTTLSAFIRGQAMVCLFLALFYGIGLTLIGLDLGFGVGFVAGVLSFIPYVGSLTGFILSLLLAVTQAGSWWLFGGILLVFGIGQFLEGYVVTPKLVGDKVGLHPAWIIFALFAGGSLFGFLGVLLAVPITAVLGVLLRDGIGFYKNSLFYKGKK